MMNSSQIALFLTLVFTSCNYNNTPHSEPSTSNETSMNKTNYPINKTDEEWKKQLSAEQFQVLRNKGTERPFTSQWNANWDGGIYVCVGCGNELFSSENKFDAGCGWPSFFDALDSTKIKTETDSTHGMKRTEIMCANCGGHLGHVFDDGPKPTGLRFCVNGVSIDFKNKEK